MKKRKFQQENKIIGQGRNLCCDIVSKCHDITSIEPVEAMSQQVALYRNKDQAELKPETKIVATSHNFVERLTKKCCDKEVSVETKDVRR